LILIPAAPAPARVPPQAPPLAASSTAADRDAHSAGTGSDLALLGSIRDELRTLLALLDEPSPSA
jgi:hypothetical protein